MESLQHVDDKESHAKRNKNRIHFTLNNSIWAQNENLMDRSFEITDLIQRLADNHAKMPALPNLAAYLAAAAFFTILILLKHRGLATDIRFIQIFTRKILFFSKHFQILRKFTFNYSSKGQTQEVTCSTVQFLYFDTEQCQVLCMLCIKSTVTVYFDVFLTSYCSYWQMWKSKK